MKKKFSSKYFFGSQCPLSARLQKSKQDLIDSSSLYNWESGWSKNRKQIDTSASKWCLAVAICAYPKQSVATLTIDIVTIDIVTINVFLFNLCMLPLGGWSMASSPADPSNGGNADNWHCYNLCILQKFVHASIGRMI